MSVNEYRIYEATYEASRIIVQRLDELGQLKEDRRGSPVDPTHHQMRLGLCLELAADGGLRLWTPWGEWTFCLTSLKPGETLPKIPKLELLRFEMTKGARAYYVPPNIFAIHRAGHLILPYARERTAEQMLDGAEASQRWHCLSRRFASQNGMV